MGDHELESRENRAQMRAQAVAEMVRAEPGVLQVRGDCMTPVLRDGQRIQLSCKTAWLGDVVAVRRQDGGIVVHRFLMKRPWFDSVQKKWVWLVVTRPDQGSGFDPEVPYGDLLGVVSKVNVGLEQPFRTVRIGALDRARALGWSCRYWMRRVCKGLGRLFAKALSGIRS